MIFVLLALKSLLITGTTLLLLRLLHARSAAERSTVAHLGLLALVALPLASLALPSLAPPLPVTVSRFVGAPAPEFALSSTMVAAAPSMSRAGAPGSSATTTGLTAALLIGADYLYLLPTLVLLGLTLAALLRLLGLRARADVVVDPVWLGALARTQRRLGFKNGTALLNSDDLASPVSWGLLRPTILLNEAAVLAPEQAEAIIAHELAHVVHLDWIKLIVARVATAAFWFNPLAWLLAREAHQLREEAADDDVIRANISRLDYAELLIEVARNQRRTAFLGAHGLAAPRDSLRRRVQRVLEKGLSRSPSNRAWMAGSSLGMLVMAGPLAAFTITPSTAALVATVAPHAAANGTSAAFSSRAVQPEANRNVAPVVPMKTKPMAPMKAVAVQENNAGALLPMPDGERIDADVLIDMRARGITPAYKRAMADAGFPDLTIEQLTGTHSVGISPDDARALLKVGMPVDYDDLMGARVLGLEPGYITAMRDLGITGSFSDYRTLWVQRITPNYVRKLIQQGVNVTLPRQLIELKKAPDNLKP